MAFDLQDIDSLVVRSARGKRPQPAAVSYVRDLGPEDAELITNPPALGSQTPSLVRLRTAHHALARLLAEGVPAVQASAITGYSLSRITILQADPAFADLLSYYKGQVAEKYLDVHERLGVLGMTAVEELQERLEERPEEFKNRELMELAEMALDRSLTRDTRPQASTNTLRVEFVGAPAAAAPAVRTPHVIDATLADGEQSA